MEELILGIDLCDDYSQASYFDRKGLDALPIELEKCAEGERRYLLPTIVCRRKDREEWYVGQEAYGYALSGEGVIVDKLVKLLSREGTATIEGKKYTARYLMQVFLGKILETAGKQCGQEEIGSLCIALQTVDAKLMDSLVHCVDSLNIPRERLHLISRTEGLMYYVMSQKREVWNNQVGVFELSDEGLHYYELHTLRNLRNQVVQMEHRALEEGFSLDILENTSGAKLADNILCACGERLMQKKVYSSVFLTGRGFDNVNWAENFLKMVCKQRKVFSGQSFFAKGAAFKAFDLVQEKSSYPYVCLCEGRLHSSVTMDVIYGGKPSQLILASAGDNWYESKASVELIPDGQDSVDLMVVPVNSRQSRKVIIPLEGFPKRPNKTTKLEITIGFTNEDTMMLLIRDKGFGDLFPASNAVIRQEVRL